MTVEQAKTELKKIYWDRTDAFIDALGKSYPDFKPADLFDIDIRFRPEAIRQATLKANQKGAPVYMYLFTWESPVMDGMLRSMHCKWNSRFVFIT
jgi:para-nitrobenzyl esterase